MSVGLGGAVVECLSGLGSAMVECLSGIGSAMVERMLGLSSAAIESMSTGCAWAEYRPTEGLWVGCPCDGHPGDGLPPDGRPSAKPPSADVRDTRHRDTDFPRSAEIRERWRSPRDTRRGTHAWRRKTRRRAPPSRRRTRRGPRGTERLPHPEGSTRWTDQDQD
ncbi:hypothetical protein DDJ31_04290 [Streptomyces griseoviridis]|uniref:Uncharacterized protein n=1 Tax=Streptomyces griseoviridis TaxID=45398 RepID=A0ABX5TND4_STRGD|nr:hypothetical protein DDJ31_04290 [Streptomyces griseoviridis]